MTADIVVSAGKSGIVVDLPPGVTGTVSIDMNGFSIIGQPGSVHAVHVLPASNVYLLCYSVNQGSAFSSMGGSGLRVDGALSVSVSGVVVRQCGGDGLHFIDTQDISLSSVSVEDTGGNGVHAVNGRRLTACCLGSSGQDGVELSVAFTLGYAVNIVGFQKATIAASVTDAGLDGIRIEDTARCDLSVSVVGAGGNGITALRVPDLTCGVVIKTKGTGADKDRVANTGGHGIHAVDCGTVTVVGMSATSCTGYGLHISGASTVFVSDWRDDDCDDDGIEIAAGGVSPPLVHVRDAFSNNALGSGMRITCSVGRIERAHSSGAGLHGMDIECDSLVMSDCTSSSNAQCGMNVRIRKGIDINRCVFDDNGYQGALLLPVLGSVKEKAKSSRCSARGNGFSLPGGGAGFEFDGISSVSMHECDSSDNAGSGVLMRNINSDARLHRVTCSSNGLNGVHVPGPTSGLPGGRFTATGVLCDGNGFDGMLLEGTTGGEVSECVFSSNGGLGLHLIGSSHVVRSNSCTGNVLEPLFVIMPGNVVGPVVDELSVAGNCNPAANYVH